MLTDPGWTQDPAAQFSYLFPHSCFFFFFLDTSCFSNCQVIKYKCIQLPFLSSKIFLYLYSNSLFLISCYVLLFSSKVNPKNFVSLKNKSLLCSQFCFDVLISHCFKLSHPPFPLGLSSQPADSLRSSSLNVLNQKYSP